MLEKNNALLEENIALLQVENERLKGKEIATMESKIESQRQQIQHLTSLIPPSISDTTQRQNISRP